MSTRQRLPWAVMAVVALLFTVATLPGYSALRKNTASQLICAHLMGTSGADHTTGTVDLYLSHEDGTAQVSVGAATYRANGEWCYTLSADDTNHDYLHFTWKPNAGITAHQSYSVIGYDPALAQVPANLTHVNGTATTATLDSLATAVTAVDDYVDTEVAAILADTGTDGVVVAAGSKTGYSLAADQSAVTVGTVSAATLANGAHGGAAASLALGGGLTANIAGAITGSLSGSVGSVASGGITSSSIATGAIDADALAADTIIASKIAADAGAEIADAVWDEALAGHAGAGTAGAALSAATAPSAATVADAVWDEAVAGHAGVGSTGAALAAAGGSGDPWSTAVPGAYGAGTAGYLIGTNLNATVSSRSTYAGGAVASVTGAVGSVTAPVTAGTVSDKTGYALTVAPLDAAGVRAAVGLAAADLDDQLAALPTATENAAAVRDVSNATPAAGSLGEDVASASAPSAASVADAVWDEALSGHAGAGTAGAALSAAGTAGDPWSTALPGPYTSGTGGYILGNILSIFAAEFGPGPWAR